GPRLCLKPPGPRGAGLGATARLQDRHLAASGHAIIAAWLDATGLAPPSEAARTASAPTGIASKQ
ncbi:MAG: hypothetical protein L0G99_14120, partial [Propionibacteriales bacterium]|nr:hypothetical protein [Propionibacteriales bacterium]